MTNPAISFHKNIFEQAIFGNAFGRAAASFLVKRHNTLQFFGYEVSNLALIANQAARGEENNFGMNDWETGAALAFLTGSAAIYGYSPESRPALLFWGGLALTAGGLCLAAAGFGYTGYSVALASLETARGGLGLLEQELNARNQSGQHIRLGDRLSLNFGRATVGLYAIPVQYVGTKFKSVGKFLDERPFVTGTLIKAPMRLEFIGKKILAGDWIGAGVGMAWLVLGDLPLTLNDPKVKAYLERMSTAHVPKPDIR